MHTTQEEDHIALPGDANKARVKSIFNEVILNEITKSTKYYKFSDDAIVALREESSKLYKDYRAATKGLKAAENNTSGGEISPEDWKKAEACMPKWFKLAWVQPNNKLMQGYGQLLEAHGNGQGAGKSS